MLRSLDALIGFTTVMLLLSLVVTALTQISADLLKLRSRHLRDGILDLFLQLGWEFEGARILAREIVLHKDAIAREDFIENLLTLAQNANYAELKAKISTLTPNLDPATLLANLHRTTLELSVERPDLAASVVRGTAIARSPAGGLASEVFGVFDSMMDRASAKFAAQSRKLVALFGIVLALAIPLDTFDLLQRFLRSSAEVVVVPSSQTEWLLRWQQVNWGGVAVSALLLTLGAPFWFHLLKDLLKLRSAVAEQESKNRALRDGSQPGLPSGEQGDLGATG